jgi:agmatine/peptidylarginine deiminase
VEEKNQLEEKEESLESATKHIKRIYFNDAWIKAFGKNYSGPCSGKC